MAKKKESTELKVDLIPIYESHESFLRRKNEVQKLIAQIIIRSTKRGRPRKEEMEGEQCYTK